MRCLRKQNIRYITLVNFAQTINGQVLCMPEYTVFISINFMQYLRGHEVPRQYASRSLFHTICSPGATHYICQYCLLPLVAWVELVFFVFSYNTTCIITYANPYTHHKYGKNGTKHERNEKRCGKLVSMLRFGKMKYHVH